MPWKLPDTVKCCGCIKDLQTAAAIIAVWGIVTSPAVSWAVVRHAYVIRVSCYVTTSEARPDVVDINLNNILSFGFGANAGLGPSCLGPGSSPSAPTTGTNLNNTSSGFLTAVKYIGWIILFIDFIFLFASINFLYRIFNRPNNASSKYFVVTASLSAIVSFIYTIFFVSACVSTGGSFPVYEFIFAIIDLLVWFYFLIVVQSYRRLSSGSTQPRV